MDDFGVPGGGGGRAGGRPYSAVAESHTISYCIGRFANSPAVTLYHTLCRFPASRYARSP